MSWFLFSCFQPSKCEFIIVRLNLNLIGWTQLSFSWLLTSCCQPSKCKLNIVHLKFTLNRLKKMAKSELIWCSIFLPIVFDETKIQYSVIFINIYSQNTCSITKQIYFNMMRVKLILTNNVNRSRLFHWKYTEVWEIKLSSNYIMSLFLL